MAASLPQLLLCAQAVKQEPQCVALCPPFPVQTTEAEGLNKATAHKQQLSLPLSLMVSADPSAGELATFGPTKQGLESWREVSKNR